MTLRPSSELAATGVTSTSLILSSFIERKAIKEGLGKIKDVPSVVYGKVTFDTQTRRVADPFVSRIEVKNGKWAAYEGGKLTR